jgi:gliotoxin/aspirochlorine biosynthesis thioredoxin reductase
MMVRHIGNMALQLAEKLTVYTNGNDKLAEEILASMEKPRKRISIERRKIKGFAMASDKGSDVVVKFEDGEQRTEGFIVSGHTSFGSILGLSSYKTGANHWVVQAHHPQVKLNGPFVEQLGLELAPTGEVKVNPPFNETSVPGVFAAGDVATQMRAVLAALSMGGMAGVGSASAVQADLAAEEV